MSLLPGRLQALKDQEPSYERRDSTREKLHAIGGDDSASRLRRIAPAVVPAMLGVRDARALPV